MFGTVDFREDRKKRWENEDWKLFGGYLVGREREREKRWWGLGVFSPKWRQS